LNNENDNDQFLNKIYEKICIVESSQTFLESLFKLSNSKVDTFINTTQKLFNEMILRVGKVENISKHISNNADENLNKISNLLYEYRESTNNSLKSNLESQFRI